MSQGYMEDGSIYLQEWIYSVMYIIDGLHDFAGATGSLPNRPTCLQRRYYLLPYHPTRVSCLFWSTKKLQMMLMEVWKCFP